MSSSNRGVGRFLPHALSFAAITLSFLALYYGGAFNGGGAFNVASSSSNAANYASVKNAAQGGGSDSPVYLSLYSNAIQTQAPATSFVSWTNTTFSHVVLDSTATPGWTYADLEGGEVADRLTCKKAGNYVVHFGVQAQVSIDSPSSNTDLPSMCKPCNLRYSIRATIQTKNGEEHSEPKEIPGSLTYSSGHNFYLSKTFYIPAREGDIFQFQFNSPCQALYLQPSRYAVSGESPSTDGSYPASANLVISSLD
jgi:hypothetical protein